MKRVTMGGGCVSKIVQNRVTSFMDDPFAKLSFVDTSMSFNYCFFRKCHDNVTRRHITIEDRDVVIYLKKRVFDNQTCHQYLEMVSPL